MDEPPSELAALLPRLRRFGMALTGSVADADELVQDACERMLRRAGQLRDAARLDAWGYAIMRHLWTDRLRARRVRRHDGLEAASGVTGDDGVALAEGRIALADVRRALDRLSPDHRVALMLVCVDGLGYREAADVLGVPVGTVMSRLSRGRRELHERLSRAPAKIVTLPVSRTGSRPEER